MNKSFRWLTVVIIFSLLIGMTGQSVPAADVAPWQEKIDPWVLTTAQQGETEFLVMLVEQADLSGAVSLRDKTAKGTYVYETLASLAVASQLSIRASLDAVGAAYQPYWVVNALWVRGDLALIRQIAQRPDVAHVYANPQVQLSLPEQPAAPVNPLSPTAVEWNIIKINADDVWAEGYTGQGAVIGGQDTGYQWDHLAIKNQYRGWDGASADHNYNWHDATGGSPNVPADPQGHGTHTMGTMVGDDGGSNQVGVAPGARWIGCRNMNSAGWGSPSTYIECYQWFVAPTDLSGNNPNPAMAPDVINNSWGCPVSEGCDDPNILLTAVQNLRAAGIVTAHSAGNSGSSCGTVNTPAGIYAESFTVGATNSSDTIASFSSRGPVTVDGSNRWKPNISAPGVSIRSCTVGGGYASWQGTSMAAPHIAGVVALLISAKPALAGQVDVLETLIEETALARYTTQGCGGDTPASHPNHTYGWGRVDAWAAYQEIPYIPHDLVLRKNAPESVVRGRVLTYTLTITHSHPFSATHNVVLTDTIPAGTDFITATGSYSVTGDLVTWGMGDLEAGASDSVAMIVQVPLTATGTITNALYGAVSDEAQPVVGDPVFTFVHQPGVQLGPTGGAWANPGDVVTYTRFVTNTGNYTDTYQIDVFSVFGWTAARTEMVTLGVQETHTVTLIVNVPLDARGGESDVAVLDAASQTDPDLMSGLGSITRVYYRWFLPLIYRGD